MTRREQMARRRRRRARIGLMVSCAFAAVVLGTGLPLGTLLHQRAQERATAATVRHLQTVDQTLAAEAKALSSPATVQALAHSELDDVEPGQRAFDVVPASGQAAGTPSVGHERLDQPVVVPGSSAALAALGVAGLVATPAGATTSAPGHLVRRTAGAHAGFLERMVRALEFWR
jgi:hypothetical protein